MRREIYKKPSGDTQSTSPSTSKSEHMVEEEEPGRRRPGPTAETEEEELSKEASEKAN